MSLESYCKAHRKEALLKQWCSERNLPLTPETVAHSSRETVWWRCENGHFWQTQLRTRVYGSTGCPHCTAAALEARRKQKPKTSAKAPAESELTKE